MLNGQDGPTAGPEFDLEDFMNFSHETRISSEALAGLTACWDKWKNSLKITPIGAGPQSAVAVWLPEHVEREIDAAWEKSPGEGFMLNNLAQYLCMTAVGAIVPQTSDLGCAPAPEMSPELEQALAGSPYGASGSRRYGVLTWWPFRGGCEICALRQGCPRLSGSMDFMSATLPGYEAGQ